MGLRTQKPVKAINTLTIVDTGREYAGAHHLLVVRQACAGEQ